MSVRLGVILYALVGSCTRGGLAILAVFAAHNLKMSPTAAGTLVAVGMLAMRCGRVAVAPLTNKTPRSALKGGFLLCAAGMGSLAMSITQVSLAWVGVCLLGVGYGLIILVVKISLVNTAGDQKLITLGWLAIALNIGAALGPTLFGIGLSAVGAQMTLFSGAAMSGIGFVLSAKLRFDNEDNAKEGRHAQFRWRSLLVICKPQIAFLVIILAIGSAFYVQFPVALPIAVNNILGPEYIGLIFVINALIAIAAQQPVNRLALRNPTVNKHAGVISLMLFSCGFFSMTKLQGIIGIITCVLLVSVAECLLLPFVEEKLSRALGFQRLAVAFSLSALAMGIGEAIGSTAGVRATLSGVQDFEELLTSLSVLAAIAAVMITFAIKLSDQSIKLNWRKVRIGRDKRI